MKKLVLISCALILAVGAAVATAQTPSVAAEASPLSATETIAPSVETDPIDIKALLAEADKSQEMSTTCGVYRASSQSDCNWQGCYAIGCGFPSHYDTASCNCYCSYMF